VVVRARRDQQLVYVANPEEERSPDSYLHRTPSRRYVGGTLVFTQVRPRPPEKFPNTLDFVGYGRAHRTLSPSGACASPHWRSRLIDGWSILTALPADLGSSLAGRSAGQSVVPVGLGNSKGLRPSGCPLHSSAGRSGMSWSARLATSERSTSQAIYATRGKSRGCAPLRDCQSSRPVPPVRST
jgi:hypothetical protein